MKKIFVKHYYRNYKKPDCPFICSQEIFYEGYLSEEDKTVRIVETYTTYDKDCKGEKHTLVDYEFNKEELEAYIMANHFSEMHLDGYNYALETLNKLD